MANEDNPVFWGCGLVWIRAPDLKKLRFPIDERNYQLKGFGEINGRRCVVLRSPNLRPNYEVRYEFWVDPERGSSILRSQYIDNGQLSFQIDADWQKVNDKWFPMHWTLAQYWPAGIKSSPKLETSFECNVERVVFNPKVQRSDFDVHLQPRMIVYDVKEDKAGVIASDGKTLLPLSALKSISRWALVRTIAWWVAVAALVVAAGWYLRRRWVSRAAH